MPQPQKLYQILEKAHIETKIAVEIQDWIVETMEEKRKDSMVQFEDTKLLPMHHEMRTKFEEVDRRFVDLKSKMDFRFNLVDEKFEMMRSEMLALQTLMNGRFDALLSSNRLLAIPIVGTTIGGLGIILLEILKKLSQ